MFGWNLKKRFEGKSQGSGAAGLTNPGIPTPQPLSSDYYLATFLLQNTEESTRIAPYVVPSAHQGQKPTLWISSSNLHPPLPPCPHHVCGQLTCPSSRLAKFISSVGGAPARSSEASWEKRHWSPHKQSFFRKWLQSLSGMRPHSWHKRAHV